MLISNASGSYYVVRKIAIFIIAAAFVKQAKPFIKTASIYRPTWAPPNANCLQWYKGETFGHSPIHRPAWVCPLSQLHPSMISGHSPISKVKHKMVAQNSLLVFTQSPSKTVLEPSGLDQARSRRKWKSCHIYWTCFAEWTRSLYVYRLQHQWCCVPL